MSDDKSMRRVKCQGNEQEERQQPERFMEGVGGDENLETVVGEGRSEGQHRSMFGKSLQDASVKLSTVG